MTNKDGVRQREEVLAARSMGASSIAGEGASRQRDLQQYS